MGVHEVCSPLLESMMFQYYLKIVPTMFEDLHGSVLHTNQFSTTRHQKAVSMMSGESGMPGVFFSYEISPIMIKFAEKRKWVIHLYLSSSLLDLLCFLLAKIQHLSSRASRFFLSKGHSDILQRLSVPLWVGYLPWLDFWILPYTSQRNWSGRNWKLGSRVEVTKTKSIPIQIIHFCIVLNLSLSHTQSLDMLCIDASFGHTLKS